MQLRLRISPEAPLLSWLKHVQQEQVEIQRFDYSPLVDIQRWSEVPAGRALFENIFVFENYPVDTSSLEARQKMDAEVVSAFERTSYAITAMAGVDTQLTLRILYDRRWVEDTVIARMLTHFRSLLEDFTSNSDKRLSDLSMITQVESNQLINEFNVNLEAY